MVERSLLYLRTRDETASPQLWRRNQREAERLAKSIAADRSLKVLVPDGVFTSNLCSVFGDSGRPQSAMLAMAMPAAAPSEQEGLISVTVTRP